MDARNKDFEEKDINDAFDAIAFSEERISGEAFQEGLKKGKEEGKFEGYHLGFHKGLQFGTEIGFYKGLSKVLVKNLSCEAVTTKNEKIKHLLEKLTCLLNNFPENSDQDIDILKQINDIRASYRKLNSLLKLNLSFPQTPAMSF